MTSKVIPAIIPKSYSELCDKVASLEGSAEWVQVDVVDGVYAGNLSWPFIDGEFDIDSLVDKGEYLPYTDYVNIEVDIMAVDAHLYIEHFYRLGARRIVIHLGDDIEAALEYIEAIDPLTRDDLEIGVAIHHKYDEKVEDHFANVVDFFQVMGINEVGSQGHDFEEVTFDIVRRLRSKYQEVPVTVDGGVKTYTLEELETLGVERVVMGSAFWEADPSTKGQLLSR